MRAVVTGATGFIGSRLSTRLHGDGHEVAFIPRGTSYEQMVELFCSFAPDVVYHLATFFVAEHRPDQIPALIDSNVLFGNLVLEAMTNLASPRLINVGTSWQNFSGSEFDPTCLYASTKQAFIDIAQYYVEARNLHMCTIKLFDTYGPRDPRPKLIPKLLQLLRSGDPINLSPGEQKIDLVYIDDVISGLISAGKFITGPNGPKLAEFVLSHERVTIKELVDTLEHLAGKKLDARFGAKPYRHREIMDPWQTGRILPGWQPETPLIDGLTRCWKEANESF